jgi:hypothetical protein
MDVPRTELQPASKAGWLRRLFTRAAPSARVIAQASARLGDTLDVEWWLMRAPLRTSLITVTLVGSEIARRRNSARTGINVTTESLPFHSAELARQTPETGPSTAHGRGAVPVPTDSVPSVAGKLNEIAWAIVVEASSEGETAFRQEFPLVVLPRAP